MKKNQKLRAFVIFFILFITLFPKIIVGQISPAGNLRNYNAVLTTGDHEYLVGKNRFILNLTSPLSKGKVYTSHEILNTYTESPDNFKYELNEAYIDIYFNSIDLRIGKQIISYGRADGVFITDIISPLDLSEFLTQPVDLIKTGITAVKATKYVGSNYIELLVTPVFQSNNIAGPASRWFPFGQVEQDFTTNYSDSSFNHSKKLFQGSLRFAVRESISWNLDLYAMYWTDGTPGFNKEFTISGLPPQPTIQLSPRYLRKPILAYSGNYILDDNVILKSESAFHFGKYFDYLPELLLENDIEDLNFNQLTRLNQEFAENEDGFLKTKKWLISMIGLQYELSGWRVTSQLINEHIFGYEEALLQDQNYLYSTLQVWNSFLRDKLDMQVFGRYNFSGNDFWINPEANYELSDAIESGLGFHFFGGKRNEKLYGHFSFRDYKPNSFIYIKITAFF